jgi:hypothetical protein
MQTTIDMPGVFDSDFSGSSVGQGQTANSGYAGGEMVTAAYKAGRKIRTGKGYRLRLTFDGTPEQVADALFCLWDYADTYVSVGQDAETAEERASRAAAVTMRDRCRKVAVAAGLDVSDWR